MGHRHLYFIKYPKTGARALCFKKKKKNSFASFVFCLLFLFQFLKMEAEFIDLRSFFISSIVQCYTFPSKNWIGCMSQFLISWVQLCHGQPGIATREDTGEVYYTHRS